MIDLWAYTQQEAKLLPRLSPIPYNDADVADFEGIAGVDPEGYAARPAIEHSPAKRFHSP